MTNDYYERYWLVNLPHNGSRHICGFCKYWKQDPKYHGEGECSNDNVPPVKYMKRTKGFDCETGVLCSEWVESGRCD